MDRANEPVLKAAFSEALNIGTSGQAARAELPQHGCDVVCDAKSEAPMAKNHLSIARKVVDSVWKAVRMLEDRPAPKMKTKLNGRRGYGDGDIPAPDQKPDEK